MFDAIGNLLIFAIGAGLILFTLAAVFIVWRMLYKVPGPDEALVITGSGASMTNEFKAQLQAEREALQASSNGQVLPEPDPEFKIVVGKGVVVRPGQRMERLSLAAFEAPLDVKNVPTKEGMATSIEAVVIYKVGDRPSHIARAARRFAGNQDWTKMVSNVLEGHLRAIVGTMTLVDIWQNRERLAMSIRDASGEDLERLGLQIDSFQVKHIADPDGYIADIAATERAQKAMTARKVTAETDREAAESEAENAAATAEAQAQAATRQAEAEAAAQTRQAEVRAQAEQAAATAAQAGPLAQAKAEEEVIRQQTANAALKADLTEQELQATVYKEADASKYQTVKQAEAAKEVAQLQAAADSNATIIAAEASGKAQVVEATAAAESAQLRAQAVQAQGEAEAAADRAKGLAVADVTREQGLASAETLRMQGLAKAEGLAAEGQALTDNMEAFAANKIAENLPAVVAANAQAFASVGSMTVLDGVDGVNSGLQSTMITALSMIPTVLGTFQKGTPTEGGSPFNLGSIFNQFGGQLADDIEKAAKALPVGEVALAGAPEVKPPSAFDKAMGEQKGRRDRMPAAKGGIAKGRRAAARLDVGDVAAGVESAEGYASEVFETADKAMDTAEQSAQQARALRDRAKAIIS